MGCKAMEEKKKNPIWQFIQFNLVGLLNTLVDFLVFTLLTELLHVYYLPAKTVSYCCGLVNSYFCNSRWTFKEKNRRTKKQFLLFVAVNLVSLGVSLGIMWVCRNIFAIQSDFWCNVVATPCSLIVNFLGNRMLVFREK